MRGIVHHINPTVTDQVASAPLYDAVLQFMGYERRLDYEWRLQTPLGHTSLQINSARDSGQHDRYTPGLHHLAWCAGSRDDVDRFYSLLRSIGAQVLDPPADYPQYNAGRGYYAVFFADRDGLKLEYVWTPG